MNNPLARLVVLISGRGSNLIALAEAARNGAPYAIAGVISNRPHAAGLEFAHQNGIPTAVLDHTAFAERAEFDRQLAGIVDEMAPDFIALAGFMRILTAEFVDRYPGRLLNIHPSLLPKFPGLDTHARALKSGESEHGVSIHFVTGELDGGTIIAQAKVAVLPGDSERTLAARVLEKEHLLYPRVLSMLALGQIALGEDGATVVRTP